jgi:gamma-glutamylaminecyclotransferase
MTLLFVYGSLKRDCSNHRQLRGQTYVAPARTQPGYRLFDLGEFPGMIRFAADREGVTGEVWSIDDACLARLDKFEGVPEGLYRREPIPLTAPFANKVVETYLYNQSVEGLTPLGSIWPPKA